MHNSIVSIIFFFLKKNERQSIHHTWNNVMGNKKTLHACDHTMERIPKMKFWVMMQKRSFMERSIIRRKRERDCVCMYMCMFTFVCVMLVSIQSFANA